MRNRVDVRLEDRLSPLCRPIPQPPPDEATFEAVLADTARPRDLEGILAQAPAFFGPVIDTPPDGDDALRLWDAVTTLGRWPAVAKLKRSTRSFPHTPVSARLAGQTTHVG